MHCFYKWWRSHFTLTQITATIIDAPSSYPDSKEGEALRLLEAVRAVKPSAIIGVRYAKPIPSPL